MPAPPLFAWELQTEHITFRDNDTVFSVKHIVIHPKDIGFFYAFRSTRAISPSVLAFSYLELCLDSDKQETLPLLTHPELLGTVGDYSVGIIHVAWIDRPGQVIRLQISLSADAASLGEVIPLRQLPFPAYRGACKIGGISIHQALFPDVLFSGPVKREQVAFFQRVLQNQPFSRVPRLFLQIPRTRDDVLVSLL